MLIYCIYFSQQSYEMGAMIILVLQVRNPGHKEVVLKMTHSETMA